MTDLTIIILNFNTKDLLKDCLKSIYDKKWNTNFDVYVVDNASSDDSVKMVEEKFPQVKIIKSDFNLGFAGGNNLGLREIRSKYALLLNSDTIVLDHAIDNLVDFMEEGDFGVGSCRLINKDGSFQANTGDLPFGPSLFFWLSGLDDLPLIGPFLPSFHNQYENSLESKKQVGWVAGTAMMIREDVIKKIGLLDEALFMYAEDVDFCIRTHRAGFKIGWTNRAEIMHLGGGSLEDPHFRQWLGELKGLIYLYRKYLGLFASYSLRLLFYIFILVRVIAFLILGKFEISKTYAKIIFYL